METQLDKIMTVPEVAKYLKMSKAKVYYLVGHRRIPHLRIGRNVHILERDLMKWLASQVVAGCIN